MKKTVLLIVLVISLFLVVQSVYILDETEQAVVTQFGRAIGDPITAPGIKVKTPFIQKVNVFPKVLLEWDGEKREIPTKDKTYIWVDVFARWKIINPLLYFQNVNNETNAQAKLDNIINSAVRDLVSSYPLIETVRNTNRKMDLSGSGMVTTTDIKTGRGAICDKILEQINPKLGPLGIEVVDVKLKRINYTVKVLQNVYGRMIAERKQIAEKFRSEGRGESQKIHGEKDRELKEIHSEAYKTAQEIRGKGEAEATRISAAAYNRDPEFYSFVKTLDLYRESFDTSSSMIMSTKNDFLKYFKSYAPAK